MLSLGLPTLVLLNMSDLMEARGGVVDTLALAQELGVPVAKISATRGAGLDSITHFLNRKAEPLPQQNGSLGTPSEKPALGRIELPVMGNPRSYRQWATGISLRTKYKAPISSEWTKRIDGVLLHRIWGPLVFLVVVFAVFQVVFSIGQPLSDGFGDLLNGVGKRIDDGLELARVVADRWCVARRGVGAGVFATDTVTFSVYWCAGGLWLSGAGGSDCGSGDAVDWAEREGVHSAAVCVCVRGAGDYGDTDDRE